ncbi:MAG: acyl-CoA thioesterase [Burkholderiales bacterium]
MNQKMPPPSRASFPHFTRITTRWGDNDSYGHVNNVVYYSFFDTAVNQHLIEQGVLDIQASEVIGLVVETKCQYFKSIGFPDAVTVGMAVRHMGRSSVKYQIALFANDQQEASALGTFVHVYVDRKTNRPVAIPDDVRAVLEQLGSEGATND